MNNTQIKTQVYKIDFVNEAGEETKTVYVGYTALDRAFDEGWVQGAFGCYQNEEAEMRIDESMRQLVTERAYEKAGEGWEMEDLDWVGEV